MLDWDTRTIRDATLCIIEPFSILLTAGVIFLGLGILGFGAWHLYLHWTESSSSRPAASSHHRHSRKRHL
jgi:hypothetical protein